MCLLRVIAIVLCWYYVLYVEWLHAPSRRRPDRFLQTCQVCGYTGACPPAEWGERGCIYFVRRWGLACLPSLLEAIGFDPAPQFATFFWDRCFNI